MKRKNFKSELIDKYCVKDARKAKQKAIKKGDLVEANWHSFRENVCILERERAKN